MVNARVNGEAFEEMHFSTGYRRTRTVADALDDRSCNLLDVSDANRAFSECVDRGVLTPWIETTICGADAGRGRHRREEMTEGPEEARCLAFDTQCTRGRFDETAACCSIEAAPAGTLCGPGGSQMCNGGGECVSPTAVPLAARVPPPANWLTIFSNGPPTRDLVSDEVAVVVPALFAPTGMPADVLEIWAAPTLDELPPGYDADAVVEDEGPDELDLSEDYEPDVLAIVPALLAGTARVTVLRSAIGADVTVIGYDGPMVPHALVLPAGDAPPSEVFVVRGSLDQLPTVLVDGSTAGAVAVPCSGPWGPTTPSRRSLAARLSATAYL